MNKIQHTFLAIALVFILGCTPKSGKVKFEEQLQANKTTKDYQQVQLQANSDLKKWLADSLEQVMMLKDCNWKVDEAIFFNSKRTRCYLLLLLQDKDKQAELDYAYQMYAALESNKWTIYFASFPNMVFPRERVTKSKNTPIPLVTLSTLARGELLRSYYKADGSINDTYIDEAYTTEVKQRQAEFLLKKYQ
jgi:hypothetical protein